MRKTLILITAISLTLQAYSQTEEERLSIMINDSLKLSPNNSNWLFFKGMALCEYGKFGEAIPYLTLSLKNLHQFKIENPTALRFSNDLPLDSCDILHLRAYCYDTLGSISNSIADYRYLQTRKLNDFFIP